MKLVRKLLPLTTVAVVGTIPFTATSCSKVLEDLLNKQYVPKDVQPLTAQELSASEAETEFYNYFKDKKGSLSGDALWGASFYARTMFPTDNPLSHFETFLSRIDSFDLQEDTSGTHRFSYALRTQVQVRDNTQASGEGSYSINTYDISFEMHNIECYVTYYNQYLDGTNPYQIWSLTPNKYNVARGRWYQELTGNESIKFEIKAVFKGYSETGAQNYVRETSESAIIDEAHKYVPELNDVYTELMLLTPYYLSNVKPRMFLTEDGYPTTITKTGDVYSTNFEFDFGTDTLNKEGGDEIKLTPFESTYLFSPTASGAKVKSIKPTAGMKVQSKISNKVEFEFEGTPNVGDVAYYCIEAKHPAKGSEPEWFEWFTVSSIV